MEIDSFYSFLLSLRLITNKLKIDLTKENKIITNSLGVVVGEINQERIMATEILEKAVQVASIQKTSYQRIENGCVVISQTTTVNVVRLPYCARLEGSADSTQ